MHLVQADAIFGSKFLNVSSAWPQYILDLYYLQYLEFVRPMCPFVS
jgi:hypothetical protein